MILVRGPWDETLGTPDLPFDVNHSMSFPGVYKRGFLANVFFVCPFMYTRFIIVGCLCREKSKGQTGALGGKSQFYENPKAIGDFRAGAAS